MTETVGIYKCWNFDLSHQHILMLLHLGKLQSHCRAIQLAKIKLQVYSVRARLLAHCITRLSNNLLLRLKIDAGCDQHCWADIIVNSDGIILCEVSSVLLC